ncbi:MAG: ABC transporter ATP-binding protein [Clostridia bacterium]|nr:ABC transporter ATP-binding protein [Clostridia bacterium]
MKDRRIIIMKAKSGPKPWLSSLLSYHTREIPRMTVALLLTIACAGLALLIPLVFSFVVDTIISDVEPSLPGWMMRVYDQAGGRPYFLRNLWIFGLIILLMTALDGLMTFLRGKWSSRFAESGARRIRQSLFNHLQALPFSYHARAETGDLIQRCTSDSETVRRFFNHQVLEIMRSLTLITVAVSIMFRVNVRLALIGLIVTPIVFVTSAIYFKKERQAFRKWDEAEGELSTILQEYLTGIRVVKAFARQAFEREKFMRQNTDLRDFGWKTFTIIANFWMFSDFMCFLQIVAVTIAGTVFTVRGQLTLGQLVIFISYTEMLIFPLRGLARIIADAGRMHVAWHRIQEVLEETPEPSDDDLMDTELQGSITFENVTFSYDQSEHPVLQNINLSIQSGETIGVLGPTGSGKSSLLYLLQRLYEPDEGTIRLDGMDLRQLKRSSVRRQIGLILQEPFVFSRSIFDNIRLPRPQATRDDVLQASKTAALHDDVAAFEQGYETVVGERGVTLSGGQKQRLTIARTLIRECPIVIFDDSMSAVDTDTDLQIRRELASRQHNSTTILVSHRISTLSGADRIVVLEEGRITQEGRHADLIRQDGMYRRVYQIQSSLEDEADIMMSQQEVNP